MCVLTYIPHGKGHFTITHNRDENIHRPFALPPTSYVIDGETVVGPLDPQSGGTWFALHQDWVCCLLNGGFEKHQRKTAYRESRGTVIPSFFKYLDVAKFMYHFNAIGFEPFTLVVFNLKKLEVHQLVWDEHIFHCLRLDGQKPHIWSSSTLYSQEVKKGRQQLFDHFNTSHPNADQVLDFHQINRENDWRESLFVNIDDVIKTVAITQASGCYPNIKLRYKAFQEGGKVNA